MRDLKGGGSHTYRAALGADQYLSVVIEQQGVELEATLVGADGSTLTETDDALGGQGFETLTFIARIAAESRLEVRATERYASAGRYEITIVARRAPTADERTLEGARRQFESFAGAAGGGEIRQALPLPSASICRRLKPPAPTSAR